MIPFYAAIKAIFRLKRTCPKCGRDQVVKLSQKTEAKKQKPRLNRPSAALAANEICRFRSVD